MRRPRTTRAGEPPIWLSRLHWRARGQSARIAFAAAVAGGTAIFAWLPPTGSPGVSGRGFLLLVGLLLAIAVVGGAIGSKLLRGRDPSLPRMVARDRAATGAVVIGLVALCVGGILHRPTVVAAQERFDGMVSEARRLAERRAPDYALERLDEEDTRRISADVLRVCFPVGRADRAWCAIVRRVAGVPKARTDSDPRPNDLVADEADQDADEADQDAGEP